MDALCLIITIVAGAAMLTATVVIGACVVYAIGATVYYAARKVYESLLDNFK